MKRSSLHSWLEVQKHESTRHRVALIPSTLAAYSLSSALLRAQINGYQFLPLGTSHFGKGKALHGLDRQHDTSLPLWTAGICLGLGGLDSTVRFPRTVLRSLCWWELSIASSSGEVQRPQHCHLHHWQ